MKTAGIALVVLLSFQTCLSSQEPSVPSVIDSKNLGILTDGKYLNEVVGVRLDLPTGWTIVPKNYSDFPRHLLLQFSSQNDRMVLSGIGLDLPGETLSMDFDMGLQGTIDGGGFKKFGKQIRETRDGHKVRRQKLIREVGSGDETADYIGFFNRGYCVSILLLGPPRPLETRATIIKSLNILSDTAK
jgi:hypothetical protein